MKKGDCITMFEDECRSATLKRALLAAIDNMLEVECTYVISKHMFDKDHSREYIGTIFSIIRAYLLKYVDKYKDLLTDEDYCNINTEIRLKINICKDSLYIIYKELNK